MNGPRKIILDTDPALGVHLGTDIDDDLAIIMLLASPEVEILGLTCTYGNSSIKRTYGDAKRLLHLAGRDDIPVKKGAGWLSRHLDQDTEASRFIAETIKTRPGEITMVTIGPLTNLAAAIYHNPGIMDLVPELVMMGGRLSSSRGEFNFAAHPEASNLVLQTPVPKFVATMELCLQVAFTQEHLKELEHDPSLLIHPFLPAVRRWLKLNRFATSIIARKQKAMAKGGFYPWDPIGAAYLIDPSLFSEIIPLRIWLEKKKVMVSRDVADLDERLILRAPKRVDGPRFMRLLLDRIKKVKRKT
jgi:inosine-uridine nucleoside N-ribohydrolase